MLVLTLLLGILYPLVVTGISQVAFPGNANGQQVFVHGKLVGSKIIGQNFGLQVFKNGKPETAGRRPGHDSRPAVLPGASVGDGAAKQRRRHVVRQLRAEQHDHQSGDPVEHRRPTSSSTAGTTRAG